MNHHSPVPRIRTTSVALQNTEAFSSASELIHALEQAATDATVRVVVLRGGGKGFCPGDDLGGMGALPADFALALDHVVNHSSIQTCLRELPKPTIAAIHGYAFGVGLDLAMACDFRIATDDAQLRDQRVLERGMHAVTGCAWFQPRAIGTTRALEFLILGKPCSGIEACEAGMVTSAVAVADFDDAVDTMATRLALAPTKAIGLMKQQIYHGQSMSHAEFHDYAAPLIRSVTINDREEGINAFLEKRHPQFSGE